MAQRVVTALTAPKLRPRTAGIVVAQVPRPPIPKQPLAPVAGPTYHFVLWKWRQQGFRQTYTHDHVNVMAAMISRWCPLPHRVICVTDETAFVQPRSYLLWDDHSRLRNASGVHLPSCYRRLKLFDRATQEYLEIPEGDLIVSMDIDAVILDDMAPLLMRGPLEKFTGWAVPGTKHPKVLNGSMWMFRAGTLQWMWDQFDPVRSPAEALRSGFFGSDQSYISMNLVYAQDTGGWTAGDGVLSYPRDVRGPRVLPRHARIVFFHGKRKPWDTLTRLENRWIDRYWRP